MGSRLATLCLFLLVALGLSYHACQARLKRASPGLVFNNNAPYTPLVNKPVPLEAHIMSKCPDARDALQQLVIPVMQRVYDKVDFTLSYIGRATADDGVSCLHGPSECMGNILELCARELYSDPKINLGFVMCLSKDYQDIPDRSLIADCALEHAVSLEDLNECATRDDGAHGLELLRNSVKHSADADVTKSATIRLNNEIYCIRDDNQWKDCPHGAGVNDLVLAIEKLYHARS